MEFEVVHMDIQSGSNISSKILQNNLALSQKEVEKSIVKISSGQKLSAFEDAANLVLSETMEAQARGSETAIDNSLTGMNVLETADSGLGQINDNLQKIRDLSIQAANDTYGEEERAAINKEISSLTEDINRISGSTSFNNKQLLDGSSSDMTIQTGANSDTNENSLKVGDALSSAKSEDLGLLSSTDIETSLNSSSDYREYIDKIDNAIDNVTSQRANIGAYHNRLESNVNSMTIGNENILSAQSRIRDTDVAAEMSKLTQNQILSQASASLIAQANQMPQIALSLL